MDDDFEFDIDDIMDEYDREVDRLNDKENNQD